MLTTLSRSLELTTFGVRPHLLPRYQTWWIQHLVGVSDVHNGQINNMTRSALARDARSTIAVRACLRSFLAALNELQ